MNAQSTISLLNVLVPILTPILGAIAVSLRDRSLRRSDIGRRKLALEDARAQVEFVNEWWSARRAVDVSGSPGSPSVQEVERQARASLEKASKLVAENELSLPPVESAVTFRKMALLYDFRTTAGKVVRAGFWIFCGITLTAVGATISEWLRPPGSSYSVGFPSSAGVRSFVIAGAVIIPLTIALRFLAAAVDDAMGQPNDPGRDTYGFLRELLLLRRLRGRGSGVLRALFYLSASWVIGNVGFIVWVAMRDSNLFWLPLSAAAVVFYGTASCGIRAWAVSIDRASRRSSARRQPLPLQESASDQVEERTLRT